MQVIARLPRRLALALGPVVVLAACGGGGGSSAAAPTTVAAAGATGGGAAYRQCLADNGVTLPNPGRGGGQQPADGQPPAPDVQLSTTVPSTNVPSSPVPSSPVPSSPVPSTPGQPSAGSAGRGGRGFAGLDQSDPTVAKALAACQDKRPISRGGGPGRGGPMSRATKDCLTAKGVTVTDGQQLDRSNPDVQAALQACRTSHGGDASASSSSATTAAG